MIRWTVITFFGLIALNEILLRVFSPEYRLDFLAFNKDGYIFQSEEPGIYYSQFATGNRTELRFTKPKDRISENVFRIVVLGDSASFGQQIEQEKLWSYRLHSVLAAKYPEREIEVINCAVIASSLMERYDVWEKRCSKYRNVDLVIFQSTLSSESANYSLFFGDSLGRSYQIVSFLYPYYLAQGRAPREPMSAKMSRDEFGLPMYHSSPEENEIYASHFRHYSALYRYSHYERFIEHQLLWSKRIRAGLFVMPIDYSPEGVTRFEGYLASLGFDFKFERPEMETATAVLTKLNRKLKAEGTELLVLILPNAKGLELPPELRATYDRFLSSMRDQGVKTLDFHGQIEKSPRNALFIDGDVHLNDEGNRLASEFVTGAIDIR